MLDNEKNIDKYLLIKVLSNASQSMLKLGQFLFIFIEFYEKARKNFM